MAIARHIIEVAATMAAGYASKGITITPLADTPMADIRAQSRVSTAADPQTYSTLLGKTTDGTPVQMAKAVDAVNDQLDGFEKKLTSARADVSARYVDMIYPAVLDHLNFARNTVKPVILSAIENFNKLYVSVPDPEADIAIVRVYKPEVYANSEFADETLSYNGKGYDKRRISSPTFNLPKALQYQEIIDFLSQSFPPYKTEITSWLTRLGSTSVERLWGGIFTASVTGKSQGEFSRDDYVLMDYLMCKAMRDNPPEGVQMSLSMWRAQMDDHVYVQGDVLATLVKNYSTDVASGLLVAMTTSQSVVCVYSQEYDNFLSIGGSDNLLRANSLSSGNRSFHSKSIIANAESLQKAWTAYAAAKVTLKRADQVNIARKSAYAAVEALIVTDYAKLFGWQEAPDATPQLGSAKVIEAKRSFKAMCESITLNTLAHMGEFFVRAICASFYQDTAAYKILTGVDKVMQSSEDSIDPKQAADIATLEYICEFVADQLKAVAKV